MQKGIDNGWLSGVRRILSPNSDERPTGTEIDLVVIHGISLPPGVYGGPYIDQLFTNNLSRDQDPYFVAIADARVSAHVLIRRDGSLTQYVPFERRAWHAGPSSFAGRDCCNDFSIGIELEGVDDQPYSPDQYQALASLLGVLMLTYPRIQPGRICGHSDIAPGRKTDPGPAFDWRHLHSLLGKVTTA